MALSVVLRMQVDPELVDAIARIATMQTIAAVATVIVGIALLGAALGALRVLGSVRALVRTLERNIDRLAPRADPVIEGARRIVDDLKDTTAAIRRQTDDVAATARDINRALRDATREAERRVRELAAVLDIVQEETEALLLDGASTARGIHAAAARLRGDLPPHPTVASDAVTGRAAPPPAPPAADPDAAPSPGEPGAASSGARRAAGDV
jgi:uncharacterized protein YoxC